MQRRLPPRWDDWLAFFASQLPHPVRCEEHADASLTYTAGDPGEVIVRLTPRSIRVAEFTARQLDPADRRAAPRWLGRVYWRRMREGLAIGVVEALLHAAREGRRATFRRCELCERRCPPEWMVDAVTCRDCAAPAGSTDR
jgi:hypothetical protein